MLVVDDDPDIRLALLIALGQHAYAVETASNGAEALNVVRHGRLDAMFVDVMMPVMNGPSFIRACRAEPAGATVPIAIMSGTPDLATVDTRFNVYARPQKPFTVRTLLSALEAMLRVPPA